MPKLPALKFKPLSEIRPVSALRTLLDAEAFWPHEILEQPSVMMETKTGPLLFLTGPDLVQAAVMAPASQLPRSRLQQRFAGNGTGRKNVITEIGQRNQIHRRSLAPLFRAQRLPEYLPFIQATIRQAINPWFQAAEMGEAVDATRGAVHATFGVVWQIMLGEKGQLIPPEAVGDMADGLFLAGTTNHLPDTSAAIERAARASLPYRPKCPLAADTPFGQVTPEGLELTEQEIEHNIRFLFTAGHESTALTISWAMLLLALHPEIQEKVAKEVREIAGIGEFTMPLLRKMTQLSNVVDEAMRLYPAGPVINREAVVDFNLVDLPVKAGTQVAICFYGLHRHEQWWDNPNCFDPDRFDPAHKRVRHPSAFMPFSAGPHSCLGGHLAWTEAMVALASAVRELTFTLDGDVPGVSARYTLRPDGPVKLRFASRV